MMQQQLVNAAKQQQPQASAATILADQFSQKIHQSSQVEMHRQQQQQRINYCTICNKELCNKYFMKTHMLKMHKISLEMEQPEDEESECTGRDADQNETSPSNGNEDRQQDNNDEHGQQPSDCSSSKQNWSPNSANTSSNNKSKLIKRPVKDNLPKKQAIASTSNKPATSVLNGFAGNSMGGVVCDICNKELCSKYFLKVHKQNTHGVMTDYQDANQFMYPFASTCGPNPFMAPPAMPPVLSAPVGFVPATPLSLFTSPASQIEDLPKMSGSKKSKSAKRLRLSGQHPVKQEAGSNVGGVPLPTAEMMNIEKLNESNTPMDSFNSPNKQFESVYRLIFAQQQQQQHQQPPVTVSTPQPQVGAQMGMSLNDMPMAANPLSALMCFGAMGPTGPFGAAMSPAMIVDNILRNQHLFNRNNVGSSSASMQPSTTNKAIPSTDRNNNNNDLKQANNSKTSKDSSSNSNSRYFSHYTEACPMCDRRFKSIKWLKTHMMNDHKQEIATYMQMMMQYLYTSKSQQMAAAATMAAIEQQQQNHQSQLTQQLNHQTHSQIQPSNLMNKCFGQETSYQQQLSANMMLGDQNPFRINTFSQQQQQQHQQHHQQPPDMRLCSPEFGMLQQPLGLSALDNYVIDARYRQESSSPGQESLNRQSPNSPSSGRSQLLNLNNRDTSLNCGINFELSKLAEHRHKSDDYLPNSPCAGSELAEGEDEDGDSDKSRDAN